MDDFEEFEISEKSLFLNRCGPNVDTIIYYFGEFRAKLTLDGDVVKVLGSIRGIAIEVSENVRKSIVTVLNLTPINVTIKGPVATIDVDRANTPITVIDVMGQIFLQLVIDDIILDAEDEVRDVIRRHASGDIRVNFGNSQVVLDGNIARFVTKWSNTVNNQMEMAAMETIRDPDTKWEKNVCECTNQFDLDVARGLVLEQRDAMVLEVMGGRPRIKCRSGTYRNVAIILEPGNNRVEYKKEVVYEDDHPLIDAIILNKHRKNPDYMRSDILKYAREVVSMFTNTYDVPAPDVLHRLLTKRISFSVDKLLTVVYNSWEERNEIEQMDVQLHFKDIVNDGTDTVAPLRSEALRVYFTKSKRYYYYSIQQQGEITHVHISGLPDFSKYCIYCQVTNNRMQIHSFFYKLKDRAQKEAIKSVDFKGYGSRGMLLVKFIAMRMGVEHIDLTDDWKGTPHINSEDLKEILQAHLKGKHHHKYLENRVKIDKWIAFFEKNKTLEKAAQHGFYGGFGFVPWQDKMTAKPEAIVCAARIYA